MLISSFILTFKLALRKMVCFFLFILAFPWNIVLSPVPTLDHYLVSTLDFPTITLMNCLLLLPRLLLAVNLQNHNQLSFSSLGCLYHPRS